MNEKQAQELEAAMSRVEETTEEYRQAYNNYVTVKTNARGIEDAKIVDAALDNVIRWVGITETAKQKLDYLVSEIEGPAL